MAEGRNLSSSSNCENVNQRRLPRDHLVELSVARLIISEFLESKKNHLRRLINDPRKVSYARAIKQEHMKLKKEALDNRFLTCSPHQNRIMDKVSHFKQIVNYYLNSDSNVILNNMFNYNLLDTAIVTGCVNILKDFFNVGFYVNSIYDAPMERCCIPLHRAAQNKQTKIVELLIQYGAEVNMLNYHNKTALFYAVQAGDLHSTLLLLNCNAQINDPDILTAGILSKSPNIIRLLLKCGADVNQKDLCGRTPLHFVSGNKKCQNRRLRFKYEDYIRSEMAKILLESGANVDATTTSGITPLHAAALKGYSQVAESLLINGATVDTPFTDNKTALFYASYNAYTEVVKVLLKHGADINILDAHGRSVLNMAYTAGRSKYVMVCNEFEPNVDIILQPTNLLQDEYESDASDYDFYDFNFYRDSREKTINVLEKHVVKMITAGMFVRDEIKYQINMCAMASFKRKCEKELNMMKEILLVNHLTGFHLITMNLDELAIYTRNSDIKDVLLGYNYSEKFPLYGVIIQSQIQAAIKREAVLIEGCMLEAALCLPGPTPPLPYLCTEQIVRYLDNTSINHLINAFNQIKSW